jgi:hypothetical protein
MSDTPKSFEEWFAEYSESAEWSDASFSDDCRAGWNAALASLPPQAAPAQDEKLAQFCQSVIDGRITPGDITPEGMKWLARAASPEKEEWLYRDGYVYGPQKRLHAEVNNVSLQAASPEKEKTAVGEGELPELIESQEIYNAARAWVWKTCGADNLPIEVALLLKYDLVRREAQLREAIAQRDEARKVADFWCDKAAPTEFKSGE